MEQPLKTIEEENKIREASEVEMVSFPIEPQWEKTGIESPFGGEILENDTSFGRYRGISIKYSKTERKGIMKTDNTPREIIKEVIWED